MECDASLLGTGSVLYHEKEVNGKIIREIIRYGSKRFSITESLNHTSLEREAMAILIGVKQHMSFLEACPEAVIKTDLKSLITLLSCYNNPASTRFAIISHRLYALPFKWSLIHSPGVDIPLADMLSRLPKPYVSLYTDRHLRYPDLKRDNIMMPPEWRNKPDLKLTTADLLEAMRQQIVFVEKSSNNVKEKRLKALINEVSLQFSELTSSKNQLAALLEEDLSRVQNNIQKEKQAKLANKSKFSAITSVSPELLITPHFISNYQKKNTKLANIITMLRTLPLENIPKAIYHRFRLLNDSILVTRKNKELGFDDASNLRIVCDARMTIHILSILHVMTGHCGMNTLNLTFTDSYKCIEKSTQGFVKLVCTACRSCRYHRQTNKKVVPEGRIPIPNVPNDTWMVDFMVFKQEQTFNGRKVAAAFNIVDLFSNLFISIPVKDQTTATVIDCFKRIFAQFNVPRKIVSDNATSLCRNPDVLRFLKASNVKQVVTTTAYNSQANKVERMHKTFRDTLKLVQETFKREKPFDMYYQVVQTMNLRPLSLSLHPHIKNICKELKQEPGVITPFSLHFGLPPVKEIILPLEQTLEPVSRAKFIQKWKHIITEYDRLLQQDLEKRRLEQPKPRTINVGDLVILKNNVAHKESLRFYKNIYEVLEINHARYKITPLFFKGRIVETNGNNLKPYESSDLLRQLPQDLRNLLGENLSKEELKKQSEDPDFLPDELNTWTRPTSISLRNRLAPRSKLSEPALSILNTSILTDSGSSDSSSSLFNISDSLPDFKSDMNSLLKKTGASQLKSTPTGIQQKPIHISTPPPPLEIETASKQLEQSINLELEPKQQKPLDLELENSNLASNSKPLEIDRSYSHIPTENITVRRKPQKPILSNSAFEDPAPQILNEKANLTSNLTTQSLKDDCLPSDLKLEKSIPKRNTIVNNPLESKQLDIPKANDPLASASIGIAPETSTQKIEPSRTNPPVASPTKVNDPKLDKNNPESKPKPEPHTESKPKPKIKINTNIPESIKHRLRSATLRPFKFIQK